MQLAPYVEDLNRQLETAVDGDEARAIADRLIAPLQASARLMLLDALSAAAGEISAELAPGSVEVRLRSGEPEFVVVAPPAAEATEAPAGDWPPPAPDEDANARINLRLSDALKSRVEEAAGTAGLSINAWLVRAITASVNGDSRRASRSPPAGGDRFSGWVS